jgi:pimeloyl-ACP methyl ester carboxylesterase
LKISSTIREGRRAPVLLIHGNSSCSDVFAHQMDFLAAAGHGVVAPDLPGHGRSADARRPRSTYSFPGYAAILSVLMQRLGFTAYHILGWSLGGHIGIEMWSSLSEVRSLTITGTPPVRLSPDGAARGFRGADALGLAGKKRFSDGEVRTYGTAMLDGRVDGRLRVAKTIARTDGRARHWMVRNGLAGVGVDEAEAVRVCPRPLAILQGKHDPFVDIDYLQNLDYRNLWLRKPLLLDAGHAPHWKVPALFNSFLKDFLTETD